MTSARLQDGNRLIDKKIYAYLLLLQKDLTPPLQQLPWQVPSTSIQHQQPPLKDPTLPQQPAAAAPPTAAQTAVQVSGGLLGWTGLWIVSLWFDDFNLLLIQQNVCYRFPGAVTASSRWPLANVDGLDV